MTVVERYDISQHRGNRGRGRPAYIEIGFDPEADPGRHWSTDSPAGKVIQAIRVGMTHARSCVWADITEAAFMKWRRRGQEALRTAEETGHAVPRKDVPYVLFVKETERASVAGDMELLVNWRNAARDDWRAAAKLLAVRHPEEFSEQHQLKVSGDRDNPIVVEQQAAVGVLLADPRLALQARELAIALSSGGVAPVLDVEPVEDDEVGE